ncbi:Hexose_transporter [Hexamita inflata]|uniref:Hexose transporter n=1 Tax=Hexamita inflata TaxID=28002 RepID=A0AA86U4D7_9EUKA|nr:Hexose transporter [Hexamita inflata]
MNAVIQYASQTFANSFNSPYSGTIGFIIVAVVNTIAAIVATPFIRLIRRRLLWFVSLLGCMICQVGLLILSFDLMNQTLNNKLKLILTIVFILFYQLGISSLYLAILSEVFPLEVKTKMMNFGMVMFWLTLITTTLLFPLIPRWCSYLLFLSIQTICFIILFKYLPETTGKTLQEIRKIMVDEEPKVEIQPATNAEAPLE